MQTTKHQYSTLNSLPVILLACFVYLCFWNWSKFSYVYTNGELVGPDDFLRMSQIHAWMQGQGWFDLTAYKMVPPQGGDIHWSRLVDVPIAGLIYFFNIFFDFDKASYLAAIVWPLALMLITIAVWTLICDRLLVAYPRWLPALFGILSISSINQFSAGRIDHHNIQILLFGLMILGLVNRERKWGDILIGFAAAFSMSIGAEALVVIVPVLAIIGFEWAMGSDANSRGIIKVGVSLIASSLTLYILNFAPQDYFNVSFDANSLFFLAAFILLGLAFILLGMSSSLMLSINGIKVIGSKLALGGLVAGIALVVLYLAFPDYLGDPFANMSEEAKTRWLNKVSEAKSLSTVLRDFPFHWLATVGYYLFVLGVGALVLLNKQFRTTKMISLYIILFVCVLGTIWQVRVIRTAAFLVVPFCVIFSTICWNYFKEKYSEEKIFLYGFQSGVVMFQISIFWYIAGALFFPLEGQKMDTKNAQLETSKVSQFITARRESEHCMVNNDFNFLKTLPTTNIVSDLTTSTALMFHTKHSIISGPYHRNERAILDTLDFMGTNENKAKAVAEKYQVTHLAFCTGSLANPQSDFGPQSVTAKILQDDIPTWLNEVSAQDARIRVFKIIAD